ncbi:MAG TPA: dihydrolipoyl dehydrogenase, partial [Alkalispirochaeta sp.]|nr:dihydrolipoyl dehydrogenase [Alkalispirochaeta sp.]
GLNPTEAADAGYDAVSETLPLQVSGRYLAEHPRERGTVTLVADRTTRRLLGVQMLGSGVGEIIHSAAAMIEQELRIEDIREVVFPHPTVSEVLRDAAWALH